MDSAPYQAYAAIYDATGQTRFSLRAWAVTREHLRRHLPGASTVLDLACGTAAAAAAMAADGYRVIGLDRARPMLLAGRERAAPVGVALLVADMTRLPLAEGSVDCVTIFYDAVNYLTTPDGLGALLAEAGRVLRPGGLLAFDWLTTTAMREDWNGVCRATASDDLATIWSAQWHPVTRISALQATFFVPAGDGLWSRFDERHDERGLDESDVLAAAATSGLRRVLVEDYQTGRKITAATRRGYALLRREPARGRR